MKRTLWAVGFVLFVYAVWGRPTPTLKVVGELGPEMRTALRSKEIPFEDRGTLVVIKADHRDELVEVLASLLADERKRMDVISNNIANSKTTKTVDGTPYRRQLVKCGPDGFIYAVVEDKSAFNWVYDPAHPDAMKEGANAGYVAMPNVNPARELAEFEIHQQTAEALIEALRRLDPDLIICMAEGLPEPRIPEPAFSRPVYQAPDASVEKAVSFEGLLWRLSKDLEANKIVVQTNSVSCGQACVAMACNRLLGTKLNDRDIDRLYGFQLLQALKRECRDFGYNWRDAGNINADSREFLTPLLDAGLPVILALNGSFDPGGHNRGHIVLLESSSGEKVTYVDPWDGQSKTTTWTALCEAPSHPDGNFLFVPERMEGQTPLTFPDGML